MYGIGKLLIMVSEKVLCVVRKLEDTNLSNFFIGKHLKLAL